VDITLGVFFYFISKLKQIFGVGFLTVVMCLTLSLFTVFRNFMSGIVLIFTTPFQIGDILCHIDKYSYGRIANMTYFKTDIILPNQAMVTIPNLIFLKSSYESFKYNALISSNYYYKHLAINVQLQPIYSSHQLRQLQRNVYDALLPFLPMENEEESTFESMSEPPASDVEVESPLLPPNRNDSTLSTVSSHPPTTPIQNNDLRIHKNQLPETVEEDFRSKKMNLEVVYQNLYYLYVGLYIKAKTLREINQLQSQVNIRILRELEALNMKMDQQN